jgi:hypothetical protein
MRPPECRYSRTVHSWEFALDARQEDARTLEKPNWIFNIKERLIVLHFLLLLIKYTTSMPSNTKKDFPFIYNQLSIFLVKWPLKT